jgi:outer membrane protein OmpA-like peptidoglycan-associated protein
VIIFMPVVSDASGPSAPPKKSPTANVGRGPTAGKIPTRGKIPVPSPTADVGHAPEEGSTANTGPAPVEGSIAKKGKIPIYTKREGNCTERLSLGSDTLFAFDKSDLSTGAEEALQELGPMIVKFGKHPVIVEGNTDSIGTDEYNQGLSERRANTVLRWLKEHNFVLGPSQSIGFGKRKPVAPNTNSDGSDNPAGRQLNRRVDVVIDTCK